LVMLEVLVEIVGDFWGVLGEMSPYLLFGFLVAGVLSVFISASLVERHLGGRGFGPAFKAAALGVPLPLCSCGVIPVAASLRKHGASRAATTAFLMSTPQTGVDSILVTFSLLGGVFAIFRPLAALVSGVAAGMLVSVFDPERHFPPSSDQSTPCNDACCQPAQRRSRAYRALAYGFGTLPRDIGPSLLIGLGVAALISAVVPKDFFAEYLGTGLLAMVVMMLVGLPVYVCATASIPVAAMLVIEAGISPGAAFAFLVTGPATNAATIATMWRILGRRTTVIYLLLIVVTALAGGLMLDQMVSAADITDRHVHVMLPQYVKHVSAVALLGVLGVAVVRGLPRKQVAAMIAPDQARTTIKIGGVTCSHCVSSVRRALGKCRGVLSVEVDLAGGAATVTGDDVDYNEMSQAVTQSGYEVQGIGPVDGPSIEGDTGNHEREDAHE